MQAILLLQSLQRDLETFLQHAPDAAGLASSLGPKQSASEDDKQHVLTVLSKALAISGTQLMWLQSMLSKVVDWQMSSKEGRICVQNGTHAVI